MKVILTGSIVVSALLMISGCSGPKYKVTDGFVMPPDAKVGVLEQTKCVAICSDPTSAKLYTDTLRARLEAKLLRPVTLVSPIEPNTRPGQVAAKVAERGKEAGVDYVVAGTLGTYQDPSSGARSGALAATVVTSVLPISVLATTHPMVNARIQVVRVSDGTVVGHWGAQKTGGNFSKCTSMTEDIADVIAEYQFGVK